MSNQTFDKIWKKLTVDQKQDLAERVDVTVSHLRVIASSGAVGRHLGMLIAISLIEMEICSKTRKRTLWTLFPQHKPEIPVSIKRKTK